MKFLFFAVSVILFSSSIFSQDHLQTGKYSIGGDVSFWSTSSTEGESEYFQDYETNSLTFNLSPSFSYMVTDYLELGIQLTYNYAEHEFITNNPNYNDNTSIYRSYGIGPKIRYSFTRTNMIPFVEAAYFISKYVGQDGTLNRINMKAGLSYFLSKNAAVEPALNYQYTKSTEHENTSNGFGLSVAMKYYISE